MHVCMCKLYGCSACTCTCARTCTHAPVQHVHARACEHLCNVFARVCTCTCGCVHVHPILSCSLRPWTGAHQRLPVPSAAPAGKEKPRVSHKYLFYECMVGSWCWVARIPRKFDGKSTSEGNLCLTSCSEARKSPCLFQHDSQ